MSPSEIKYLDKYRDLSARQLAIAGVIGELKTICGSLADWQTTAGNLASAAATFGMNNSEWSDERLKSIMGLRSALIEYHQLAEEVQLTWANLSAAEKIGLAEPRSLKLPK